MAYYRLEKFGDTYRLLLLKMSGVARERAIFGGKKLAKKKYPDWYDEGDYWEERFADEEERFDSSIARSKARIRELALCNPWEYFATFTLSPERNDRFDLAAFVKRFGYWIGDYNKRYGASIKYIMIPEKHPTSGAWHAHGLLHDVSAASLVRNEFGYLDLPYYRQRFGFISLSPVKSHERVARYITKYVTKEQAEVAQELGKYKHLYYASRGLKGKEVIGLYEGDWETNWENEFVGIVNITAEQAEKIMNLERNLFT